MTDTAYLFRELRNRVSAMVDDMNNKVATIREDHSLSEDAEQALLDLRDDQHEHAGGIEDIIREHEQEQRINAVFPDV